MTPYRYLIVFVFLLELSGQAAPLVFAEARTALAVSRPRALALNDLNGDGKADLMVSSADSDAPRGATGHLTFYFQKDGTFADKPDLTRATPHVVFSLMVDDCDQDGKSDLAANSGKWLYLLFGATGLAMPAYGNYNVNAVYSVTDIYAIKDFMRAKRTFLVGPTFRLWNGDAKNRDRWGGPGYLSGPVRNDNAAVVPYDMNFDGHFDLVALSATGAEIRVYYGPFFTQRISPKDCSNFETWPCSGRNRLAVGDLDHDGRPDIVATSGRECDIFFQAGPLGFPGRAQKLYIGGTPYLADLDGDGLAELALLSRPSRGLAIYGVAPDGKTLAQTAVIPAPAVVAAFGDIDGDGRVDFAAGDDKSGVRIFLNVTPVATKEK